jgi:hypothetical protein
MQLAICDLFRRFAAHRSSEQLIGVRLSTELADAFEALAEGYIHPLVRPATKKPGQRTWPALKRCQVSALHYVERANRGDIKDPHPVKTVSEAFGVTRRLLRFWRRSLAAAVTTALKEPCAAPDLIVPQAMKHAATAYRRWRVNEIGTHQTFEKPSHGFKAMRANRRGA